MELIFGLFVIHQWWPNYFVEHDADESKFREYARVQQAVLDFYFHFLESNERVAIKFKVVSCLLSVLELVCSDCF